MIKRWMKWRKKSKTLAQVNDDPVVTNNSDSHSLQCLATAAFHTETKPRTYRGPRSCPDDLRCSHCEKSGIFMDSSFDFRNSNSRDMMHRNRRHLQRFRPTRASTSEYGSGDPSPVALYTAYNRRLDNSDSDSWTVEYERTQHIIELESRIREQKKKLRDYKEKLRVERDLRVVNERNMMEEVEKYKHELKKEERERKATEQRCVEMITYLKNKLSLLEQQQSVSQRHVQPSMPIFSGSNVSVEKSIHKLESKFNLPHSLQVSTASSALSKTSFNQELDETKNFRAPNVYGHIEIIRSSDHIACSEVLDATCSSTTVLQEYDSDNDDNGYVTTSEFLTKATQTKDG
ncbi:unnamed protein product [Thelazia callipaeda]|uniref:EF-hand domain-containing protein n=1 Tax=Thelazia callipaeda TaxID=103827 RepID=A0A0N5D477_THECL|nr:unnamed protein product [Thelazia callipaeda]